MNETWIQDVLYRDRACKGHDCMCPNIYLFDWESDLVSVTNAGFIYEYEIKISRGDFKADEKKRQKWDILRNGSCDVEVHQGYDREAHKWNSTVERKPKPRPARFWYACPAGLIAAEMLPDFAGLLWITAGDCVAGCIVEIVKPAPQLHSIKATAEQYAQIGIALRYRYWGLRMRLAEQREASA